MAVTHCSEHARPVHSGGLGRRQTSSNFTCPKETLIVQLHSIRIAAWKAVEASVLKRLLAASLACSALSTNAACASTDHFIAAAD